MLPQALSAVVLSHLILLVSGDGDNRPQMSPEQLAAHARAEARNQHYSNNNLIILAAFVATLALYRAFVYSARYIRTLACLNNATQRYFRMSHPTLGSLKKNVLYAPLFRTRRHRTFRLASMNLGTLPTRLHSFFFLCIVVMNVCLCACKLPWHGPRLALLGALRNRSGTIAVVNMIPLMIIAGRNNPLIAPLNLPFDAFNLFHRLFGRIVTVQAIVHSVTQIMIMVDRGGWKTVIKGLEHDQMITTGFIGIIAMVVIIVQASSAVRHAFYETFLHLHIALAIMSIAGLWYHLDGLSSQTYLKVVIAIWGFERAVRLLSLVYRNFGRGGTEAVVETLPGDAVRINVRVAHPWHFSPGQHAFITIPSIGLWTSHPFSVAWNNEDDYGLDSEKGIGPNRQDMLAHYGTTVSFVARRRAGFTDALFRKLERSSTGRINVKTFIEGPYGGTQSLQSYGTVILFAGGVGITHQVSFVRDLVAGYANGTTATRRVCLVWVIQSPEHLEWIRPWMTTILAMDKRRDVLRIQLFVTRPRSTKEIHSPSATVQMFPGKPNVDTLVGMECEHQIGAMAISVCGTGGLSDDVRRAVRRRQGERCIDFFEESFSW